MFLERTISQLDIGSVPPAQAQELGHLGYMQWLSCLPGDVGYHDAAMQAYDMAQPFVAASPAVAVFCNLLLSSLVMPPAPLPLHMPRPVRRGGAQARRLSL